jgi:hypothetical protein
MSVALIGSSILGPDGANEAERLNRGCFCITLDRPRLATALDNEVGAAGFAEHLKGTHPTLFSNVPVFAPEAVLAEMLRIVAAVEAAARLPEYRATAMSRAPPIAAHDFGPVGVFMGYDFHLAADGPKLIEVNTNAGGAFLNAVLARAQRACCAEGLAPVEADAAASFGAKVAQMFVDEWRRQGRTGRPRTIAIVDDAPEQQHLYPEFRLAQALLDAQGLDTVIADPAHFRIEDGQLTFGGRPIDLVYNRLVDFALADPGHAVLRTAYESGATVVSPNPHLHAMLADKRNLALLSDVAQLRHWGLAPNELATLEAGVPKTVVVSHGQAEDLWARRRELFFKPAGGHGSKATYRGDKLTHKVWAQILEADYVAQTLAPPSGRGVVVDGQRTQLKVDFRLYTYAGAVLLAAARLYQGQTTNMRTPGGGFAPVLAVQTAPEHPPVCGAEPDPGPGSSTSPSAEA